MIKRGICLLLAVFLLVLTPVGDYLGVKKTYAVSTAIGAVEYVWSALMSSAGVDVSNNDLDSLIADIGDWVKIDTRYIDLYKMIADLSYGTVVKLGSSAVDMVKDYFKTKNGYATDDGLTTLNIGINFLYENSNSYLNGFDVTSLSPALMTDEYYFTYGTKDFFRIDSDVRIGALLSGSSSRLDFYYLKINEDTGNTSLSPAPVVYINYYTYSGDSTIHHNYRPMSDSYHNILFSINDSFAADELAKFPFPVYEFESDLRDYLDNGIVDNSINDYTGSTSVDVHSDIDTQKRSITSDGTVTIPSDADTAQKLLDAVHSAVTAADRATALADTLTVTYGDKAEENDDTDTYPWIPDITKPLGVIRDVVKGISQGVTGIVDGIADLPVSITDSIANSLAGEEDAELNNWAIQADIVNKFPFCIPFDLFMCIGVFEDNALPPKWEVPFTIASLNINESIVFDLSTDEWKPLVIFVRISTLIAYCLGLIVITRNLIKG